MQGIFVWHLAPAGGHFCLPFHTKKVDSSTQNLYILLAHNTTGPEIDSEKYTTKAFYC